MSTQQSSEKVRGWLTGRLPEEWFEGEPELTHRPGRDPDRRPDPGAGAGRRRERRRAVGGRGRPDQAVPRGHPGAPDRDRPRTRARHPPQGRLGRPVRRHQDDLHVPVRPRDDPPPPARTPGPRHPRRRRRGPLPQRRPRLVRQARRPAQRNLARRPPRSHDQSRRRPPSRPRHRQQTDPARAQHAECCGEDLAPSGESWGAGSNGRVAIRSDAPPGRAAGEALRRQSPSAGLTPG